MKGKKFKIFSYISLFFIYNPIKLSIAIEKLVSKKDIIQNFSKHFLITPNEPQFAIWYSEQIR